MGQSDLRILFPIDPPRLRGGRWLIALALLSALLMFFWACGVFAPSPASQPASPYGAALFFSVNIAYIVPVFGYISERTLAALNALTPVLDDEAALEGWRRRVYSKPQRWLVAVLLIGTTSGLLHNVLLYGSPGNLLAQVQSSGAIAAIAAGTQLIWLVLTLVIAALLDNAVLLNRIARHARVRLFAGDSLRPFATVAVISTLSMIGAQAAFPIMFIEGDLSPLAYVPGLLATGIPMLLLAGLPVWPVHRRLAAAKRQALKDADRRIAALPLPDLDRPESVAELTPLLAYRRELAASSEWPFDVGVLTRLALYLIIPPLTWVGAALIENLVDAFV